MRRVERTALSLVACGLFLVALSGTARAWSKWRVVRGGPVTKIVDTQATGTRNVRAAGTPGQTVASTAKITGQQKVGDTMRVSFVDAGGVRRQFTGTVTRIERMKNGAARAKDRATATRFEIRAGEMLATGTGDGVYMAVKVTRGGRADGAVNIFTNRTTKGTPAFSDFDGLVAR